MSKKEKIISIDKEQNSILKICNGIFKKLSRSQDIELRGNLQILISKLLPLCHPSGVNFNFTKNPYVKTEI